MSVEARCTWGNGPDVMVFIDWVDSDGFPLTRLRNGVWWMGLSQEEARHLAAQLVNAAEAARKLDLDLERVQGEGDDRGDDH